MENAMKIQWSYDLVAYALSALYYFVLIMRAEAGISYPPKYGDKETRQYAMICAVGVFACAVAALSTQVGEFESFTVISIRGAVGLFSIVNIAPILAIAGNDNAHNWRDNALAWFTLIGGVATPLLQLLTIWL